MRLLSFPSCDTGVVLTRFQCYSPWYMPGPPFVIRQVLRDMLDFSSHYSTMLHTPPFGVSSRLVYLLLGSPIWTRIPGRTHRQSRVRDLHLLRLLARLSLMPSRVSAVPTCLSPSGCSLILTVLSSLIVSVRAHKPLYLSSGWVPSVPISYLRECSARPILQSATPFWWFGLKFR